MGAGTRAVAYVRVSTDKQVEHGLSLEAHQAKLMASTSTPTPPEQAIVREALELKAAGLSLRKIGERLAARGLLPRQGRAWNPKTVRDLLQAEVV
jgi:DNA invertase Pin-like site-specific DNA recombinase